jgi:hypothetical protein
VHEPIGRHQMLDRGRVGAAQPQRRLDRSL